MTWTCFCFVIHPNSLHSVFEGSTWISVSLSLVQWICHMFVINSNYVVLFRFYTYRPSYHDTMRWNCHFRLPCESLITAICTNEEEKQSPLRSAVSQRLWHLLIPQITCSLCLLEKPIRQKSSLFSSNVLWVEISPLLWELVIISKLHVPLFFLMI